MTLNKNMCMPMRLLNWIDKNKINWEHMCYNKSSGIIPFIEHNMNRIDWTAKYYNPLRYLKYSLPKQIRETEFQRRIWIALSKTETNEAIDILAKNINQICWYRLAFNSCEKAAQLWLNNQERHQSIDWLWFSLNTSNTAMDFLEKNLDKVSWNDLSRNPCDGALRILMAHPNEIIWYHLSMNSSSKAIELLKNNFTKINWDSLFYNKHKDALELILHNLDKINWLLLSYSNSSKVLKLLQINQDQINWYALSNNKSPLALKLLLENQDKINWNCLSKMHSFEAIQLLSHNPDKINWQELSENPFIFEYDYDSMRDHCSIFKDELLEDRFHPDNLVKMRGWGFNTSFTLL